MDLDQRKQEILMYLIADYIKTAAPMASGRLVKIFGLSSATLRNELAELERLGYLTQLHISSGRIPTEKGYKLYVDQVLQTDLEELTPDYKKQLAQSIKNDLDSPMLLKHLAKRLAEISQQTVIFAFAENDIFYTGISYLFNQPEFLNIDLVSNLSVVIDGMDESIAKIYYEVGPGLKILVGQDNPFDQQCSSLFTQYELAHETGVIGLLGPMRMPYNLNAALLDYTKELIGRIN